MKPIISPVSLANPPMLSGSGNFFKYAGSCTLIILEIVSNTILKDFLLRPVLNSHLSEILPVTSYVMTPVPPRCLRALRSSCNMNAVCERKQGWRIGVGGKRERSTANQSEAIELVDSDWLSFSGASRPFYFSLPSGFGCQSCIFPIKIILA